MTVRKPRPVLLIAVLAAVLMQAAVWEVILVAYHLHPFWYGFFDVSDISIFNELAEFFVQGLGPYDQVPFEYPPLALPLILLPTWLPELGGYYWIFVGEMIALCTLAAAFTAAAAARLWPGLGRPLVASAMFAAAVLLAGPIVANRYDAAVTLVMAVFAYFLARRWWWPAAAALGIGFALKLTPAMFLPLVLLLAARWRSILLCAVSFVVTAVVPFLPHLVRAGRSVLTVFTYHVDRPLQIESLFASPYLLEHVFGASGLRVVWSHGSQAIVAPGTELLATLSPWLMGGCLLVLYVRLWWRRQHLRDHPTDVPLVLLGMVLVLVCTSKVLSPQFLLWTLPFIGLVAAAGSGWRRGVGLCLLGVLFVTQLGFPSRYWDLVRLESTPILFVVARNVLLLAVTLLAVVQVWRIGRRQPAPAEALAPPSGLAEAE
jgi:hypothetical protein